MKKLLLIITGSIAAYKSLDLIRLLKKDGYEITPIMTNGAKEFITKLLVSSISGSEVLDELFSAKEESKIGHINLSRKNDAIIVAPATADFIAKMAGGFADDLASAIILASNKPIFLAPAMNEKMWLHKRTRQNLQILRQNGVRILEPKTDLLACGEYGIGKMVDPLEISSYLQNFLQNKERLKGKKVIITCGATFEPIDPVRFIGNYSSGKQGIAIAEEFYNYGAQALLIAANVKEEINLPAKNIIRVRTASEMLEVVRRNLSKTDIFIAAAAVADFRPKEISLQKIKKSTKESLRNLELVENIDILKTIAEDQNRPKIVIGFAAESENLIENARKKIKEKNCDFILANNIKNGQIFGSDDNEIILINKVGKIEKWARTIKRQVAVKLVELILKDSSTNNK